MLWAQAPETSKPRNSPKITRTIQEAPPPTQQDKNGKMTENVHKIALPEQFWVFFCTFSFLPAWVGRGSFCQSSPDQGQSRKIRFSNFWGPDWRKFSELCVLLRFLGKKTKCSLNPGLVNELSATPRGQRNWTGPIANGSEPCANLRGKVTKTFLGKSDFSWPLMVLAEQWQRSVCQCPLCPEFCSYYVPSFFSQTDGLQRDRSRSFWRSTGICKQFRAPQKGPENWCRAKIVEKCRKICWNFLTIFDAFCPARKVSKSVENIFDTFWQFLTFFDVAPFLRSAENISDFVWYFFGIFGGFSVRRCFGPCKGKKRSEKLQIGQRRHKNPTRTWVLGGCCFCFRNWEKLNRGVSKPGGFPLFSGKVQIVSRTLSGLFLIGAVNRLSKGKRTNRENPRRVPEQIGKIPEKSGKSQKGQKRTTKSRSGNPPVCNPPV